MYVAFYSVPAEGLSLKGAFGKPDKRAIRFLEGLDRFYISKFIQNEDAQKVVLNFLRDYYFEKGAGLFGRGKPEDIEAFRNLFEDRLKTLEDWQIRRIVETTVTNVRNLAHLQQMYEAGIVWAQVIERHDLKTCAFCREMHGRKLPVKELWEAELRRMALSYDELVETLKKRITPQDVRLNLSGVIAQGRARPPYHPHCRGRLRVFIETDHPAHEILDENLNTAQKRFADYWNELPPKARAEKIELVRKAAVWKSEKHFKTHLKRHPEISDYLKANVETLKNPDRAFGWIEPDGRLYMAFVKFQEDGNFTVLRVAVDGLPRGKTVDERILIMTLHGNNGLTFDEFKSKMKHGGWTEIKL